MSTNHDKPHSGALDFLSRFEAQLLDLDSAITALVKSEDTTVTDLSATYASLDSFKSSLSIVIKQLEQTLLNKMEEVDSVSLDSGTVILKEWSKNRKAWQHKDLAQAVSERIQLMAVDMDTGERTMTTGQMIEAMLDYVQPSYWRVTALSNIGLNADSFCEAGDAQAKIRIERGK